jgi:hypothetical protein
MKLKYAFLAILALLTMEKVSAELLNDMFCGVDGVYSTAKLHHSSDFKTLKASFPSVNVFGGIHINEVVSLETGIHLAKPSRTSVATSERTIDTAGGLEHHAIHKGIALFLDPYVSLMLSTPVLQENVQFFGGFGVSHSHVRYRVHSVYINGIRRDETHSLEKSKLTHRITIGTICHLNAGFSVRVTSFFKNTSKLNASNHKIEIKPKNSIHHAIGVLYNF